MPSLVASLAKKGLGTPFSLRSTFQTRPERLSEVLRILNLESFKYSELVGPKMVLDFTVENAQGLVYGYGNVWFLASEECIFKYSIDGSEKDGLYKPARFARLKSVTLQDLLKTTPLVPSDYNHIGDIDYCDGVIFAPIKRESGPPHVLLGLSKTLEVVGFSHLAKHTGEAYCTVNPWTRELWVERLGDAQSVDVYDVSDYFSPQRQWGGAAQAKLLPHRRYYFLKSDGTPDAVGGIQGIAFTKNGRLHIARCHKGSWSFFNYMRVHDAMTGRHVDSSPRYDFAAQWDEIEGLSVHPSGILYVAVADNDNPSDDEFEIHAFRHIKPTFPM